MHFGAFSLVRLLPVDLYKHYDTFSLVWVPPTDLCKHYDTFLLGWVPPTDLCKHYDTFLLGWVPPMDLNKYYDAFFTCIGPANGSEQAITYGSGNRTYLTCTGNRFQNGAFVYKSRRFGRNPPDFQKI